ncbi:MAG TPA: cytochrome c oxidase assembly protein, partial [Nocardioides sp.]|nr:cytochrome c oxidase assembly protein [Nocardioides sp.]
MLQPAVGTLLESAGDLPRFTVTSIFTEWSLDPVSFVLTVWVAGLYLYGTAVLRRRGDHWPIGRTLAFVGLGMGSFALATGSGIAAYDLTLLSVHMVQHMVLSM